MALTIGIAAQSVRTEALDLAGQLGCVIGVMSSSAVRFVRWPHIFGPEHAFLHLMCAVALVVTATLASTAVASVAVWQIRVMSFRIDLDRRTNISREAFRGWR